jgi:predicted DNA-binding transcriptional regulator AlpA
MHPHEYEKLRAPEAAKFLRSSPSTLAKWRMLGTGPRFQKLGKRIVVYDIADLKAFAAEGSRSSTLEVKHAA